MSVDPASDLRARVKAAVQEYDTVVQFHESWRIAAHDKALHGRVAIPLPVKPSLLYGGRCGGKCFSGCLAFGIIAPKPSKSSRSPRSRKPDDIGLVLPNTPIYAEARGQAAEAAALIRRYEKGGSSHSTLSRLRKLRTNISLITNMPPNRSGWWRKRDREGHGRPICGFGQADQLARHVVERTAYDPRKPLASMSSMRSSFGKR